MELPTCGKAGRIGLNRAVFDSELVPVAREDSAEWVEVGEVWAVDESVHGRVDEGLVKCAHITLLLSQPRGFVWWS